MIVCVRLAGENLEHSARKSNALSPPLSQQIESADVMCRNIRVESVRYCAVTIDLLGEDRFHYRQFG